MIFNRQRKKGAQPGGFFHLQDEKSKTRVSGYGEGDHIKLKDEYGNTWYGAALVNPDGSVVYRFRNDQGESLSGVAHGQVITLRDGRGNTWKGFTA
jgi:tRNA(Arg) A34 adenosine deaminase TadA